MPRGLFVTFEGTDGSGKTTQMRRLIARLRREGFDVVETVEPGGTPIGADIRRILLDPANTAMSPVAEIFLYFASRAQNVHQCIVPALKAGHVVVCDRFTDSTLVYQGGGRGLGEDLVRTLHSITCGTLQPDVTVYLDIDLETGLARARKRNLDQAGEAESRLDDESVEFHRAVRAAYLDLAAREPERFRVIDARAGVDEVEGAVWAELSPRLEALAGVR
jgi:dTMP kinase